MSMMFVRVFPNQQFNVADRLCHGEKAHVTSNSVFGIVERDGTEAFVRVMSEKTGWVMISYEPDCWLQTIDPKALGSMMGEWLARRGERHPDFEAVRV
jgi:hypothetical protein